MDWHRGELESNVCFGDADKEKQRRSELHCAQSAERGAVVCMRRSKVAEKNV